MTTDTPPDLAGVPDLVNLRDVGGQRAASGARVRHGVLLRGATPAFLDEAQARALVGDDGIGVRTRVDLRGAREVSEESSDALLEVERRHVHLEIHAGDRRWDWTGEAAGHDPADASARAERVAHHYLAYARESSDSIVAFVRVLLEPEATPVLVHCSAGKDRTGTAVAIVLGAIGVIDDDLVADYARSGKAMGELRAQLDALPAYRERLARLPDEAFEASPTAMRHLLALLTEHVGGPREYLLASGLGETELDSLAELLLEQP